MKTALDLPDDLMRDIRIEAASLGVKLKDLVADLLREGIRTRRSAQPTEPLSKHSQAFWKELEARIGEFKGQFPVLPAEAFSTDSLYD